MKVVTELEDDKVDDKMGTVDKTEAKAVVDLAAKKTEDVVKAAVVEDVLQEFIEEDHT